MPRLILDLVSLVKPRLTALVIATTGAGIQLVPGPAPLSTTFLTLLGTVILVGAANALNMYLERDIDGLMKRTRNRPLPARRLAPGVALWFGMILGTAGLAVLALGVNFLTAFLGLVAFVSYVLFYTPLKQKSHIALLVGAVPGALPPLMGWTAVTGRVDPPGLVLFGILFLWQIPHFLALSLFLKEEYLKARIRILPLEMGDTVTKHWMVRYSAGLVAMSLYPVALGMTGILYFYAALFLGLTLFGAAILGLRKEAGVLWARRFFFGTIIYLPLLLTVLAVTTVRP